ncbi:triose-phosphate isomerase [Fodinisporobacter ferrooxydans]|uniref:Triosephosphate isomerase n=1 Tax=Fodinisporobacter ferrooxydans TaxID=2901836 RepID=A0ABY4CP81_9BACL|nr:triose-phosphate isomerase [Alicyclobacillaceae bacterium MYW30-H2]
MATRTPFIAGNWKMHKTHAEAAAFIAAAKESLAATQTVEYAICAPFTALQAVADAAKGTAIQVGAQNMYFAEKGAYTGEVAPGMLQALGCAYVILGHSERRQYFHETDDMINKKVLAALAHGLKPILCVGEDLEQRERNLTNEVVAVQTEDGLKGVTAEQLADVVIAYEPIWAIGTGRSSTAEDANAVIGHIRQVLARKFGNEAAGTVRIQYGGSVKPENIATFMAQPEIDGALVGGASLEADSFVALVQGAQK